MRTETNQRSARHGFTLLELMITIAIIAIMASMFAMAMFNAQEASKVEKTRALIAKLNSLITYRYESYRTRRAPITIPPATAPQIAAKTRLQCLRELMRLEMPERWSDITVAPISGISRPAINQAYLRRYQAINLANNSNPTGDNQSAECLYLLITTGGSDELGGRELFHDGDIADTDSDGAPEFIDAWGHPIRFLRWAPGSVEDTTIGFADELQSGDATKDHDPFDPRHIYPAAYGASDLRVTNSTQYRSAFSLLPLIYSAGPDGAYDIATDMGTSVYGAMTINNDPFYTVTNPGSEGIIGAPKSGTKGWRDNIHNHLLDAK